jgi:hypothetical protein
MELSKHDKSVLDAIFDISQMESVMKDNNMIVKDELPSEVKGPLES